MYSQLALTEHASLNLAPLISLDPVYVFVMFHLTNPHLNIPTTGGRCRRSAGRGTGSPAAIAIVLLRLPLPAVPLPLSLPRLLLPPDALLAHQADDAQLLGGLYRDSKMSNSEI